MDYQSREARMAIRRFLQAASKNILGEPDFPRGRMYMTRSLDLYMAGAVLVPSRAIQREARPERVAWRLRKRMHGLQGRRAKAPSL